MLASQLRVILPFVPALVKLPGMVGDGSLTVISHFFETDSLPSETVTTASVTMGSPGAVQSTAGPVALRGEPDLKTQEYVKVVFLSGSEAFTEKCSVSPVWASIFNDEGVKELMTGALLHPVITSSNTKARTRKVIRFKALPPNIRF